MTTSFGGQPLLQIENLVKHFEIRGGPLGIARIGAVRAVDGVSLPLPRKPRTRTAGRCQPRWRSSRHRSVAWLKNEPI